ncbi:MAG: ABC transporter substrate-binding protein [Anaerolineaceae bacterium]|nr:ABC transporter substrate-binding protein [Anaerolineaceae bacterium]
MKKLSIVLAVILVTTMLLSACTPKDKSDILIGNLQDESGPMAALSGAVTLGAQMMVDEINAAGGLNGRMLKLVTYDTRGDVNEAINALKRMIEQDKVSVVLGPPVSNIGIAIAPITQELKVPVVGLFMEDRCTIQENGQVWDYMFLAQNSAARQAQSIAAYALNELGIKKFAILYNSANSYSVGLAGPFEAAVLAAGGEIVAKETYVGTDKDFRAQLTKIKATEPEALYFPSYPPEIPLILTQSHELGLDITMLSSNSVAPTGFAPSTDPAATTKTFYPNGINASDPALVDWAAAYQAKYDVTPLAQSFSGADAFGIIVEALKGCGDDITPTCIYDKLNAMDTYAGMQGTFKISPDTHQPQGLPMAIFTIKEGSPLFMKWYTPEGEVK